MTTAKVEYGPLQGLIGVWEGDKGLDVSPEPVGSETSLYYETLTFEAAGDLKNAKSQLLAVLRYKQIVRRKSNDEVFHDQMGYWMWDAKAGVIMQSLSIPRALCLIAGGRFNTSGDPKGVINLTVAAKLGDPDWGIIQSPFMRDNARTTEFCHTMTLNVDSLSYTENTVLEIYGRTFQHPDENTLVRRR